MNTFAKYFIFSIITLLFLTLTSLEGRGGRKRPRPRPPVPAPVPPGAPPPVPAANATYNSKDPFIAQYLVSIANASIQLAEENFFVRVDGSNFSISFMTMNWFKAYQMCRRRGGYLLPERKKLFEAGSRLLKMRALADWKFWSTLTNLSTNTSIFKDFKTGESVVPVKWAPGEPKLRPDGACIVFERKDEKTDYYLKALGCKERAHALCEIHERHDHTHKDIDTRNKNITSSFHQSVFSWIED